MPSRQHGGSQEVITESLLFSAASSPTITASWPSYLQRAERREGQLKRQATRADGRTAAGCMPPLPAWLAACRARHRVVMRWAAGQV